MFKKEDYKFIERALELAKKGQGFVSPNPCVGAVLVEKGKIIAEGWHKKAGGDHAEVMAVKSAGGKDLSKAILYVTLEPCCHFGKTPPCADLILEKKIKRVVVGMKDSFIKGKNKVEFDLLDQKSELAKKIRMMNQGFLKFVRAGLPYVTLKAGVSLDGKIASYKGDSKWITSEQSRNDAYCERSLNDAVLVGAGTVKEDDPELSAHGKFKNKKLLRIILDKDGILENDKKVFRDDNYLLIKKQISIKELLKDLGKKGIQYLYVEGGSDVFRQFFEAKMFDRVLLYIAPKLIGGKNSLPFIGGKGVAELSDCPFLRDLRISPLGTDFKLEGYLHDFR
jgi:diaminohydroxyphosphoribosylaminopyrimidine deaminase / 5-amino-6-(5-phosphoribosylamino)uracil reductase